MPYCPWSIETQITQGLSRALVLHFGNNTTRHEITPLSGVFPCNGQFQIVSISTVQNLTQFIWNSALVLALCLFRDTSVHFVFGEANVGNLEAGSQNIGTEWQRSLINQSHLTDHRDLSSTPILHSYFAGPSQVCFWDVFLQWPVKHNTRLASKRFIVTPTSNYITINPKLKQQRTIAVSRIRHIRQCKIAVMQRQYIKNISRGINPCGSR